ncbi:MAG TPA: TonB-dependent receptor [Steroidobacteraceae bacterium]|nr:TonB-dependent receptor [Steroidobacteraceae bacterium]
MAGAALAQEAPSTAPAAAPIEEVHITGSRIQRDGMTTPTPVTALNMNDLHVMAPTTLAAAVTQLPQFVNSAVPEGAPSSGWTGASGASILNLRGVGQNRTLVLLDGRRVVASTRKGTLDVNLLPDALVKSVEVVTGGASAAYGSDAVSGVVNFILDTKFEGFKSDIQGGVTELGDNKNYTVSLAGGLPIGERMHLITAVDYYKADPITDATRRDWQHSQGVISNPLAGQPGQPTRITRSNVRSTQFTEGGLITGVAGGAPASLTWTQFLPGGVPAPFVRGTDFTTSAQVGGDGQDLAWYNYFTPDTSRGSAFAHLSFDVNDHVSLFMQGLYGSGDTKYLSPPAGGQFATWTATIYWNNAYLPDSIASQMPVGSSFRLGRAGDLDYGASKAIEQQNILRSVTTGVKADLGNWKLDGYYQYGHTTSNINMDNAIRLDRIYQAIDAVKDPVTGQIVCNSTLSHPDNGCVPMNIFGVGSPSQAAIDWITQDISQHQVVEEHIADVSISGSPFDNWAGPVSMALGAAWRQESFEQAVYPVELHELDMPVNGPSLGYRGLPAVYSGNANIFERGPSASPSGGYKVKEAFAEMQLPLLAEKPLAQALNLNTAVRFADYEGSGGVWAWKAGLDWAATTDVRFRLTRSRDVRAGTLSERFDTSRGPGNVVDPESGSSVQYAISVVAGGNPNVDPEKADTLTFGVVYQPTWLEGFGMSVDAYDVKIAGAIGQLGAQAIVDQCRLGATQLCNYIVRGSDGFISTVYNLFINTAEARARGIDFELAYARPVTFFGGNEHIRARLLASRVNELSTTQVGAAKVDRAGQTGLQNPAGNAPHWQGTFSLSYERGPLSATVQERYIGSGTYDATFVEGVDIDDNSVASTALTNLELAYKGALSESGSWETYLNVTNLFDRDPPLVATWGFTGSQQTNTSLFDIYGRRYSVGVRLNF